MEENYKKGISLGVLLGMLAAFSIVLLCWFAVSKADPLAAKHPNEVLNSTDWEIDTLWVHTRHNDRETITTTYQFVPRRENRINSRWDKNCQGGFFKCE